MDTQTEVQFRDLSLANKFFWVAMISIFGYGFRLLPFGLAFMFGLLADVNNGTMAKLLGVVLSICFAYFLMGGVIGFTNFWKRKLVTLIFFLFIAATFLLGNYVFVHYPSLRLN